jgi:hypothetical protein
LIKGDLGGFKDHESARSSDQPYITHTNDHFLTDTTKHETYRLRVGRPSLAASAWQARRPAPPSYFHINKQSNGGTGVLPVPARASACRRKNGALFASRYQGIEKANSG